MRVPGQKFFVPASIFIAGRFDRLRISTPRCYLSTNHKERLNEK